MDDNWVREHRSTSALGPLETREFCLDVNEMGDVLENMNSKCEAQ